jgi:hypothetical protein
MHYVIPTAEVGSSLPLGNQKAQHTTMTGTTPSPAMPTTGLLLRSVAACLIACSVALVLHAGVVSAKSKPSRAPRHEPELKVIELKISPNPYTISGGSVEFSTVVQLPKELDGATILEVSSLVSSPSKRSIRFLSFRKPLESPNITPVTTDPHTIPVVLRWDGMDHTKAPAEAGIYQFELRAKLLSNGEKGPRTLMVSWPKRGTLEVR